MSDPLDPKFLLNLCASRAARIVAFPRPTRESPLEQIDPLHYAAHQIHALVTDFLTEAHLETDLRRLTEIERMLNDVLVGVETARLAVADRHDRLQQKVGA